MASFPPRVLHPATPLLGPPGENSDDSDTPLSKPRKANPPPAPCHALEAGREELIPPFQTTESLPAQPPLQTLPVRDLELNKEYFQVLRGKEVPMGHMVGEGCSNIPANIIMCCKFVPILFLLPKFNKNDNG